MLMKHHLKTQERELLKCNRERFQTYLLRHLTTMREYELDSTGTREAYERAHTVVEMYRAFRNLDAHQILKERQWLRDELQYLL